VDAARDDGATPLWAASAVGFTRVARILLRNGAQIEKARTKDGVTALRVAAQNGHEGVVRIILLQQLKSGAVDGAECHRGITPLFIACYNGHEGAARLLLARGADVNMGIKDASAPLHGAAASGHERAAALLLDANAAVNAVNRAGETPLLLAGRAGHKDVALLLLQRGARAELAAAAFGCEMPRRADGQEATPQELVALLPEVPEVPPVSASSSLNDIGAEDSWARAAPLTPSWRPSIESMREASPGADVRKKGESDRLEAASADVLLPTRAATMM
jgi:ankyrin repeat protein